MKKLFLFIVAAMFATSMWAGVGPDPYGNVWPGSSYEQIDPIPGAPAYITDIRYNSETGQLTFNDTYENSITKNRAYTIEVYQRTPESHIYKINNPHRYSVDYIYVYGWEEQNANGIGYHITSHMPREVKIDRPYSTGGVVSVSFAQYIDECYQKGLTNLRIAVEAEAAPANGGKVVHYEDGLTYTEGHPYGLHLNSSANLTLAPQCWFVNFQSSVKYGDEFQLRSFIQAGGKTTYKIQESADQSSWQTIKSGILTALEAREGTTVQYKKLFLQDGIDGVRYYRIIATEDATSLSDTSKVYDVAYYYQWIVNDQSQYKLAGEKISFAKPADCRDYKISSKLPVSQKENGEYIEYTQPACNVWMDEITPIYTVKFYNADYTLLKTEEVPCGESATAPSNPTMAGATFKGWSVDFSNVHKNLVVWAQYDMGSNYTFTSQMTSHANDVYPAEGFAGSDDKAMVGDKITFEATVKIPTSGTLFFQEGTYDPYGNLNWNDGVSVANLSSNEQKVVSRSADVAWYPSSLSERAWVRRAAYRFYIKASGNTVYSDGYEFDVYYKQTINTAGDIIVTNQTGQSTSDNPALLYARYGDTIFVEKTTGNNGCLHLSRTLKPMSSFETGLTEDKKAFFVCPGETEEIAVTIPNYAVVFDGAYPMQHYDFRDQGLGQYNAFYAEVAPCGGKVLPPADPTDEGYIFKGWTAWSSDYADDAYLNIPAINDNMLGFTAQWEEIPEAPLYTVTFLDWDGTTLKTEEVREGENATPPVPGGRAGYHFVGWDKPYTTITANTTITAQYGQDEIYHTVVFLDWDNTELATQQVLDGEPAHEPIAIREGYKFQYWIDNTTSEKADVTAVWSDMTVKAYYIPTEGVEFIPVPQEKARKYMIDGTIFIALPDGHVYNLNGIRVR